jgi:predicted kinase
MKNLYLLRGIPGCGKSTFANNLAGVIYSADMYFEDQYGNYNFDPSKIKQAHAWCKRVTMEAMEAEFSDITVANTFTQEWEMKDYIDMATKYGYIVFSLIIENRHGNKNVHGVPDETIKKMTDRFEVKL